MSKAIEIGNFDVHVEDPLLQIQLHNSRLNDAIF